MRYYLKNNANLIKIFHITYTVCMKYGYVILWQLLARLCNLHFNEQWWYSVYSTNENSNFLGDNSIFIITFTFAALATVTAVAKNTIAHKMQCVANKNWMPVFVYSGRFLDKLHLLTTSDQSKINHDSGVAGSLSSTLGWSCHPRAHGRQHTYTVHTDAQTQPNVSRTSNKEVYVRISLS